ncbi:MAG: hypothetical protein DCC75_13970 [Proteobacteria bacterium]|nr:MAG: hypothetical protein DCC75_13970 [Pseudomonadota bacterium]
MARSKSTSGLEQGVFNKLGVLTIYAERIDPFSGNLVNVMIDDRRSKELRKVVFAHSGVILSDSEQRRIVLKLRDGQIHEILEGKYTLTNFVNNSLLLNPDELFQEGSKHGPDQNELEYSQLREKIDYYTELEHLNKEKEYIDAFDYIYPLPKQVTPETVKTAELRRRIIKLQVEFGLRFALPFASLALAILGMALGIQPARTQRSWGAGISAVLGLSVFVLYYGMFSISLVLAQSGTLHPYLALWAPNLAILALACFLITRIASERWHSVAQALQNPLQKISGSFPRPKLASGT